MNTETKEYFAIDERTGELVGKYTSKKDFLSKNRNVDISNLDLINSEELLYRKVAFLNKKGIDYDDVLKNNLGEYIIIDKESQKKLYLVYKKVYPTLEEAYKKNNI